MTPEILLVPSGVTLVPGATGRSDVFRDDRAMVVGALARSLAAATDRAAHAPPGARGGVQVTVIAPAPVVATRTTDDGTPDLGSAGILGVGSAGVERRDAAAHPVPTHGAPLHLAASVVTVLLRLAGWQGPVRTVEIGGGEPADGLDGLSSGWLDPRDAPDDGVVPVLVFTTIAARADDVLPPGDGDLAAAGDVPSGVPDLLRRADRTVAALHEAAVSRPSVVQQVAPGTLTRPRAHPGGHRGARTP